MQPTDLGHDFQQRVFVAPPQDLKERWQDLPTPARTALSLLAVLQVTLLVAALVDIARRPSSQIRGRKRLWVAAAFINFIGPVAYFWKGRI